MIFMVCYFYYYVMLEMMSSAVRSQYCTVHSVNIVGDTIAIIIIIIALPSLLRSLQIESSLSKC